VEAVQCWKSDFWKTYARFFESTGKWPPIAPPPCGMLLLLQNSTFRCHCCFLVSLKSLLTNLCFFKDLLLLLRYLYSKFAHFLISFVRAQLIMPRVNKRRWHSPNDTQATFGTKINLQRWKGKSFEKKSLVMNILRQKWSVHCMNAPTR
jgi:hypothetical protein